MGLLSRASTLDEIKLPELAFSDFINKHSLKKCALLESESSDYIVTNSIGFDANSILSATSTADFWEGICKEKGHIYNFLGSEKTPLLQLFSFNQKDNISELSVYKNSASKILLCEGKITDEAAKDFESISNEAHENDVETLNPLLKGGSVVLLFTIDFADAAKVFFKNEYKNNQLSFDTFLNAISNEIYNRFACKYNISDTTIKNNSKGIKTVIITDKEYSVELISSHIIFNLKEVLGQYAEMIHIQYCDTADSCEKIESFLQAD